MAATSTLRQLRDAKIKPLIETFNRSMLEPSKSVRLGIGARSRPDESSWLVTGYLGTSDAFDEAMGDFAIAYADQAERDHAALKTAVSSGKIQVQIEEDR